MPEPNTKLGTNINRHEESPNPETNDPVTVILNVGNSSSGLAININRHEESPDPKTNDRSSKYPYSPTPMKNFLIRRQMLKRIGAQSQEIHIQFLSIEVLHCTAFGRFRSGDVAGLMIFPNIKA